MQFESDDAIESVETKKKSTFGFFLLNELAILYAASSKCDAWSRLLWQRATASIFSPFFFAVAVVIFFFWIFLWLSIQFRSPHSSVDIKTGIDLEEGSSAWFSAVSLFYYFFFKRNLTIFSSFHSAHLSRSSLR